MSAVLKSPHFHPHIQAVFDYGERVRSGERLACRWEKLAIDRFYADLDRNDWQYTFDHDKAIRAISFIEKLPHVKGKWSRDKKRLTLEDWQKFIIANIFGWVDAETGLRRFRKAYLKVSRKNGKSPLAAAIGLYMLAADGESGPEVYCGATTEKQAWEVFGPARQMLIKLPALTSAFNLTVHARKITGEESAKFEPLIGSPGDGSSPSCAIIDEYHEHPTTHMLDAMETGMMAREQPLLLVITTAGSNVESPCHQYEKDMQRILIGEAAGGITNDATFAIMYGIDPEDDWTSLAAIIKANPNYGVSVNPEVIKQSQLDAINITSKQVPFKTKHLNEWCWAKNAYFNAQKWAELGDKSLKIDDFINDDCFVGIDLAKLRDLTCRVFVFRRYIGGEKHYYVFAKYWLPDDSISDPELPELEEKYQRWYIDGYLHSGGLAEMDLDIVSEDIIEHYNQGYNIIEVDHDPHLGFLLAKDLTVAGLTPVQLTQYGMALGPGMTELESAIAAGRIHHDGNPITTWCIGNVLAKTYPNGGIMPYKENSASKIDGASALVMALARAVLGEDPNQAGVLNLWR